MSLCVLVEPQLLPCERAVCTRTRHSGSFLGREGGPSSTQPPSPSLAPPVPDFALPSRDSVTQLFWQSECQPQFPRCFPPSPAQDGQQARWLFWAMLP